MCNQIQPVDYKKLKPEGYGYKMVEKQGNHYRPIVDENVTYRLGTLYRWDHRKYYTGRRPKVKKESCGFCFFLSLKDARSARAHWKKYDPPATLLKIRYTKGMASFTSDLLDGNPRRFALTKEFVALEEVK